MTESKILLFPLKLYFLFGYHPDCSQKFRKLALLAGLWMYAFPFYLSIKGILFYRKTDFLLMLECLEAAFLFGEPLFRHLAIHYHVSNLKNVLNLRQKAQIDGLEGESLFYYNLGKTFTFNYMIAGFVVLFGFCVQPFISGKLPATTYLPEGYFVTFCIYYTLSGCYVVVTVVTTDALFCSLCTTAIVNFKILKRKIQNIKRTNLRHEVKKIVDQQNFLLRYCEALGEMYSDIFVVYFCFSIGAICMQTYISTNDQLESAIRIKTSIYAVGLFAQSILYSISAENVLSAASEIGDAAYDSPWYRFSDAQYTKSLVLVISKAQRKVIFSGRGLVTINFTTLTVIIKTAVSFYAYLNSLGSG
ncbi:odorant receptor 67c [Tribolium castaneum]|uniref:odorant receptor 67c n=1 Tax=Tribolium castaneum TaxID=7070 RepID=UPI0030FE4C43